MSPYPRQPSRPIQRGFTLVELVVVIVILGVLAAFAVPRYINAAPTARINTLNAFAGAVHSAAMMYHAKCVVTPTCNPNIDYGNGSYLIGPDGSQYISGYGYPMAWDTGGISSFVDYGGFTQLPYASLGCCDIAYFTLDSAPDPAHCYVRYFAGRIPSPVITTVTSGC